MLRAAEPSLFAMSARRFVDDAEWGFMRGLAAAGVQYTEVAAACERPPSVVTRQLACDTKPTERQRGRPPLRNSEANIKLRRSRVKALATMVEVDDKTGEPQPAYPTANSISRAYFAKYGEEWRETTIRTDLKAAGLKCCVRPNGPMRKPGDRAKRVKQSREFLARAAVLVKFCHFSDETTFKLECKSRKCRTMWVPSAREALPRQKVEWVAKKNTCHFWGVIGPSFRFLIPIPSGKLTGTDRRQYKRCCLMKLVAELQRRKIKKIILMQDGDKSHGTPANLKYLETKGIEVLEDWPARSPDLNPIENWWAILKKRVAARGPLDVKELQKFVLREAATVTDEEIASLVNSFPGRLKECIRVKVVTKGCSKIGVRPQKRPRD